MTERIEIYEGDITTLAVDAIVNAANRQLEPGGGVCGAIHAAAGPELARACQALAPCPTGEARITPGFDLPAKHVIHAVGPVWQGGEQDEAEHLANAYRACYRLADAHKLRSIAFPAISTGIYGYPLSDATDIAVGEAHHYVDGEGRLGQIVFCCFGDDIASVYRRAFRSYFT